MNRRKFIKVATSAVVGVAIAPKLTACQSSSTTKSSSSWEPSRLCAERRPGCNCYGSSSCSHSSSSSSNGVCYHATNDILKVVKQQGRRPKTGWSGRCGLDLSDCPYPEKRCSSSSSGNVHNSEM